MNNSASATLTSTAAFVYEQVAEELRRRIVDGTYAAGQRLLPEAEMAAQFGTTRRTLRKALALLADEGLLLRQKGRGTFVAGEPSTSQNQGLVFYIGTYEDHFFGDLFKAVSRESQQRHFRASAFDLTAAGVTAGAVAGLRRDLTRATGIVCIQNQWPHLQEVLPPEAPRPVLVDLHSLKTDACCHQVGADRFRAGELATEHLLDLGHERIVCIGVWPAPDSAADYPEPVFDNQVYKGYRTCLLAHGIQEHRALGTYGGIDEKTITKFTDYLAGLGDWPTAVLCDADYFGVIVSHAAARLGKSIPGDLSVVCVGNTPWSTATPPGLTSVYLGENEIAGLAVQLCTEPAPKRRMQYCVTPALVRRASSAGVGDTGELS